jgi:ABC-2 type transport system ATP-binding protein
MAPTLKIENLCKNYKDFKLENVSFTLPAGTILGIIGPNGAGKTTTIKLLMNMIKSDGGDIRIFSMAYPEDEKEIKERIGYVGEEQTYYANKTVTWMAEYVSSFYKRWDTNMFQKLLTEFAISRTKKTAQLSKGQKVKFALSLALSHNPDLAILDEPTAGLDPIVRRDVLTILRRFTEGGEKSVIISSHITDDIARTADYILYMINGRVALLGSKDDLLADWKWIHYRKGSLPESLVKSLYKVKDHMFGSEGLTDSFQSIRAELTAGLETKDIKVKNARLDDILIALDDGEKQ